MSQRSILVTGGAGFIGAKAADLFLREGWRVGIIDDFNDFYDPAIKRANIAALCSANWAAASANDSTLTAIAVPLA